jgi:hypothetical protein
LASGVGFSLRNWSRVWVWSSVTRCVASGQVLRCRVLMTEVRAWMCSGRSVRVHCSQIGLGHMGATAQPKRTIASYDNQRRRCRKSGISNVSESNQRSGESIDTVGVTGSIPVSPTIGGPRFWGLQSFPDLSRAALGPRERWLRWLRTVPVWPRPGPTTGPTSMTDPSAHDFLAV